MQIAPTQDNNRSQHQNPKHPANVANRVALARVKSQFASQAMPAYHGAIARAHEANREHPNTTFFTPSQSRKAARMARHNDPLGFLGNKVEGFLQLKQIAQQGAQMFNPTTRTGLLNVASMFAGGPKGDASPMMGKLGMPGQFREYGHAPVDPLERGITHETMGQNLRIGRKTGDLKDFDKHSQGLLVRSLAERAKGVGGYRRANPMDVIEGKHAERSNIRETQDMIKNYSNRQGFKNKNANAAMRAAKGRTDDLMRLDELMGSRSVPYSFRDAVKPENRMDRIPQSGEGLDNFVNYLAHYMDKGYDFHEGSMKAMHDFLFGGDLFRFPGSGPIPKKP